MAPAPRVALRLEHLLSDPQVGAWYKDHASPATARTQLEQLELLLRTSKKAPADLLAMAKSHPEKLKEFAQDYVRGMQEAGRSSKYAINNWWGIRSFLAYHEVAPPSWMPKLKPEALDDDDGSETVPSTEQMRQLLNVLPTRGRAVALLLASSGIRVGVLANQWGPVDGLRLKHLPELVLDPEPHFDRTPFLIRVPPYLAKGSTVARPRGYLTFGSKEASEALVAYLKERRAFGEALSANSSVVAPDGRGRKGDRVARDGTSFMARKALAFSIRTAMDRVKPAGVHWHTHTLRAWFSTQMEVAESKGIISRTRREFFMGHVGTGVDFDYNLDRPKTSERIEELRSSYQKCESHLTISSATTSEDDLRFEIAKVMLQGMGYTETELQGKDVLDPEVFNTMLQAKVAEARTPPKQRLVEASDLPRYLEAGWTVVTVINGHQVVLNPPRR